MEKRPTDTDRLWREVSRGTLSRRQILRRAIALGLSAPSISALLAACSLFDDDNEPAATATNDLNPAVTATAPATPPPPTGTPELTRGAGGGLRLIDHSVPVTLNPHLATSDVDRSAAAIAGEALFEWNENIEPVLFLAREWPTVEGGTLDPNGTYVIWKLRQGVKWHDGEDFTAGDVKFTWEFATDPETQSTTADLFERIASIDVIDDHTVKLNFSAPNPAWIDHFCGARGIVLPEHLLREEMGTGVRDAAFNLMPVYTGPFQVTEFRPGESINFDVFDDYWDADLPYFSEVELGVNSDSASSARAVLEDGTADCAVNLQIDKNLQLQYVQGASQGQLLLTPSTGVECIVLNLRDPAGPDGDVRDEAEPDHPIWRYRPAREALNLAIRRDDIVDRVFGAGHEATGDIINVPTRFKLNWPWEFSPEGARTKLAQVNFPAAFKGHVVLFQTSTDERRVQIQEIVQADLESLGFNMELKAIDGQVYFGPGLDNPDSFRRFQADLEMYTISTASPYPLRVAQSFTPEQIPLASNDWTGGNVGQYVNADYTNLVERAAVAVAIDEQNELWKQLLTVLYQDVVVIPIVWRSDVAAISQRLDGVRSSPYASLWSFIKYWKVR